MSSTIKTNRVLECEGLSCPMPVVRTKKVMEEMQSGEVLEVRATDKGSIADLQSWAKRTGHQYIGLEEETGVYRHFLRKSSGHCGERDMKFSQIITNDELNEKLSAGEKIHVLDVREPAEFAFARLPGANSIPLGQMEERWGELDPNLEYAVICRTGNRSDMACQLLAEKGFTRLNNVLPGMSAWQGALEKEIPTMKVDELYHKMDAGQEMFILDVRNEIDYNDWKIEGKNVNSINIPYFQFLEDNNSLYADLPKDCEIVVLCAKGGSSEFVAEHLMEKGYKAFSLEGGMLAWSQFYQPTIVYKDDQMKLIQVNRLSKGCLSYAVISGGKGMIVDPNQKIDIYLELAKQHQFEIKHVVDSHLHADHISGGPALAVQTGASYYISSGEAKGTKLQFLPLEQNEQIRVGEIDVEVLAVPTPGHTPGSTSFLINNKFLLSGDTIFVGGLGRPDLGGKADEWAEDLYDTVFNRLKDLPEGCLVPPRYVLWV